MIYSGTIVHIYDQKKKMFFINHVRSLAFCFVWQSDKIMQLEWQQPVRGGRIKSGQNSQHRAAESKH